MVTAGLTHSSLPSKHIAVFGCFQTSSSRVYELNFCSMKWHETLDQGCESGPSHHCVYGLLAHPPSALPSPPQLPPARPACRPLPARTGWSAPVQAPGETRAHTHSRTFAYMQPFYLQDPCTAGLSAATPVAHGGRGVLTPSAASSCSISVALLSVFPGVASAGPVLPPPTLHASSPGRRPLPPPAAGSSPRASRADPPRGAAPRTRGRRGTYLPGCLEAAPQVSAAI